MSAFTDAYIGLLIKQYWGQPNARAEIGLQAATWEAVRDGLAAFQESFDLDMAIGAQLDIIGRIVGQDRTVSFVLAKIAFGFSDNPNARGFGSKFTTIANVAPFHSKFEPVHTDLELDDSDMRLFIRARIAHNTGLPFLVTDAGTSMREVVATAFNGLAYVVDNKDMSLTLYVDPSIDTSRIIAIRELGLLPKPQGVRYAGIVAAEVGATLGFSNNPNALGFGSKFDPLYIGGVFARKVI